jgi:anti-sigma factor ChrR (cupin superfamily)
MLAPGVERRSLLATPVAGSDAYLIRMAPGAEFASHLHGSVEHCFVLTGDLHVAGGHITSGDYHLAAPGSQHGVTRSDAGCLLLIVEARA